MKEQIKHVVFNTLAGAAVVGGTWQAMESVGGNDPAAAHTATDKAIEKLAQQERQHKVESRDPNIPLSAVEPVVAAWENEQKVEESNNGVGTMVWSSVALGGLGVAAFRNGRRLRRKLKSANEELETEKNQRHTDWGAAIQNNHRSQHEINQLTGWFGAREKALVGALYHESTLVNIPSEIVTRAVRGAFGQVQPRPQSQPPVMVRPVEVVPQPQPQQPMPRPVAVGETASERTQDLAPVEPPAHVAEAERHAAESAVETNQTDPNNNPDLVRFVGPDQEQLDGFQYAGTETGRPTEGQPEVIVVEGESHDVEQPGQLDPQPVEPAQERTVRPLPVAEQADRPVELQAEPVADPQPETAPRPAPRPPRRSDTRGTSPTQAWFNRRR
jgi:hypothetical protein